MNLNSYQNHGMSLRKCALPPNQDTNPMLPKYMGALPSNLRVQDTYLNTNRFHDWLGCAVWLGNYDHANNL